MRFALLLAAVPFVIAAGVSADSLLDRHVTKLQEAGSVSVKFKVIVVNSDAIDEELTLSKGNKIKWDSPDKLVISDGKTGTVYNKKTKTYVTEPFSKAWVQKSLGADEVWAWTAFLNEDFNKQIVTTTKGSQRTIQGVALTDVAVTRAKKAPITVMLDSAGVALNARFEQKDGTAVVVQTSKYSIAPKPAEDAAFAFVAPADAKEAPVEAEKALVYADVSDIVNKNCMPCHDANNAKGGYDLSTYDSIMASKLVVAGNADSSGLVKIIKRGKMPPRKKMPSEETDKLAKWINDGAK